MSPAGSACLALALVLLSVSTADAGDSHRYAARDKLWQEECGACHVAYPPQLLPAASWRALMGGLDRHFGVDASLEAQTARHIAVFLESAASRRTEGAAAPVTRITDTRWFRREHDELSADVWKRPQVRSAANCPACHTRADDGDYGERTLRVPR